MGLIRAAIDAAGGVFADQWKEYFTCDALPDDVLMMRGHKKTSGRSSNWKGSDDIITKGSMVAVADGQCMIITEQGRIAEVCAEPGAFIYDSSTEPSVFAGSFGSSLLETFKQIGKRFTFGGEIPNDQRVYYINTREIMGNKYGTPGPISVRLSEPGMQRTFLMKIRCFGEYSYRITNPLLFYKSLSGNVEDEYPKERLDSQMRSELLTYLGPAFAEISRQGVTYDQLAGHTLEIRDALSRNLSKEWGEGRGIEIVKFGVSSLKGDEKTEERLSNAQFFRDDPSMLAAELGVAQAEAMKAAASNPNGAAMAFMGMGMAGNAAGSTVMDLYGKGQQQAQMQQAQQPAAAPAPNPNAWDCACGQRGNTGKFCAGCGKPKPIPIQADAWTCSCGATVTGKFCPECGAKRPAPVAGWTCPGCGKLNKGKFCSECGTKKPAGVPQYRCDKCGWEPADPTHPPKFCPECGDPFDDGDVK